MSPNKDVDMVDMDIFLVKLRLQLTCSVRPPLADQVALGSPTVEILSRPELSSGRKGLPAEEREQFGYRIWISHDSEVSGAWSCIYWDDLV